jgi:hypothetical protein
MDQVSQHRQRLRLRFGQRQGDGIADPKTHAEMFGSNNLHAYFVLQSV